MKKFFLLILCAALSACGTMQSIVKSTFPYITTVVIPLNSDVDREYEVINTAKSFDQNFSKDGNNAYKINSVHMAAAKLQATIPSDYNIGNLSSIKVYIARLDGKGEVLVASRTDIGPNQSRNLVLDIDNAPLLDKLVREPAITVRVVYKLRKKALMDVTLRIALSITAVGE